MIIKNLKNMDNQETVNKFANAITWEKCDMLLTLNAEAMKKQENIISSDDSTPNEISLAKEKLKKLEEEKKSVKEKQEEIFNDYDEVLCAISEAHNDYATNDETSVRNILPLSCCDENSKFFKLAILTQETFESFYDSMVSLHDMDSKEIGNNGLRTYSKQAKETATQLSENIQALIKKMFSISIENEYTKKVNVKFNKTDMNCVHETFVTGLSVDVKHNKKANNSTVDGVSFRYAIEKVEKKDKDPEYKGVKFKEVLAKLAFNNLFKQAKQNTYCRVEGQALQVCPFNALTL